MYFRPLPRFTAFCLPLFVALIALGIWQLERLQWKLGLIAEMNANLQAPALSLDQMLRLTRPDAAQYRHVALIGRFDNADEAFAYATGENGTPVYHLIVPFNLDDSRVVLVD